MSWRKWFVRGLVFGVLGLAGGAFYLYQHWTDPAVVRAQVLAGLETFFPGATVNLDSARLRILGGISLTELLLTSRDDNAEVLYVPAAVLYHDKEKLLDGSLKIRKVELDRPRLRLVRNSTGTWNVAGLTAPGQADRPIPTVVIHQGTVILEDHFGDRGLPLLEITHVSLTLVNDPLPTVIIDGRAQAEMASDVEIHGTWNRLSHETSLSAQILGLAVSSAMVQRLGSICPHGDLRGVHLEGKADLKANLAFTPGVSQPLSFNVCCGLTKASLRHPRLPLPLDDVSATLRTTNGQISVESLQARSGPARVSLRGSALLPCPQMNFEGQLEIEHLQLGKDLFDRLPENLQVLRDAFAPVGPATLRIVCARRDDRWAPLASGAPSTLSLLPENMQACFAKFPYPLERITGALDLNLLTQRIGVDAIGYSGDRPVYIKGAWQGKGDDADGAIDIQANDILLDEKLLHALHLSAFEKLARSFNAQGKGDIKALVRHVPGNPAAQFASEYHVYFHDAAIHWDQFPYRLREVSGFFDLYPNRWEFRDFQGKHDEGLVRVQGRTQTRAANGPPDWLVVHISGRNVAVDEELKSAFRPYPSLTGAWETFQPGGNLQFTSILQRPLMVQGPDAEARIFREMDIQVESQGCSIQPRFFPYLVSGLAGRLHYHNNRLEFTDFQGSHAQTRLALKDARVNLHPGGGFFADLNDLQAHQLLLDQDFIEALPQALKSSVRSIELKEPVEGRTDLKVSMSSQPGSGADIYWDGQAWLERAQFKTGLELSAVQGTVASRGRYWRPEGRQLLALNGNFRLDQANALKQPFRDVVGHFQVHDHAPDVLNLELKAPWFGGDVSGEARFEFGPKLRYEMNLTASQIDLQEFGRHNLGPNTQLTGAAAGRLFLVGQGPNIDTLDGNGRIDVPRGHLYNLPLLLDLLKFLGLRWPDRTMFDEVHALFNIRGPRIHVERLELLGHAVSLYGNGDFKIDGTDLKLDFYPSWGRVEQLVPPALRYIPAEIGKKMLKIEMRGRVGGGPDELKFTKKPLPVLFDPFTRGRPDRSK